MLLSMSILAKYMEAFNPAVYISDDSPRIKGMRFLADEHLKLSDEYVYFGLAGHYFSDHKYQGACIVVNGKSHMMLHGGSYEEIMNGILSAFEFYLSWENRLLEAAADEVSLQEMLDIVAEAVADPMVITDLEGRALAITAERDAAGDAHWKYLTEYRRLSENSIARQLVTETGQSLSDFQHTPQLLFPDKEGEWPLVSMYLNIDDEDVAVFSIVLSHKESASLSIHFAGAVARYFTKAAEFRAPGALIRTRNSILCDLLEGRTLDRGLLDRFAEKEGLSLPGQLLVFNHISRTGYPLRGAFLRSLGMLKTKNLAVEYDGRVIGLVGARETEAILAELPRVFDLKYTQIGVSMPFSDLRALPVGYQQARFALDNAPSQRGVYYCADYAFNYLVSRLRDQEMALKLLHPAVKALERYDAENGTDLQKTLCRYLYNERNHVQTARELNLHRNGLKYRLTRIVELTGVNLDDGDERRYLRLSYWLMGLE